MPMPGEQRSLKVYQLGTTGYREIHTLQQRLQAQRREGAGVDSLLLTEHRPVLTLGRSHPEPNLRVSREEVEARSIEIVPTERGGDITYHGPGQLVAYGIIDLKGWDLPVLDYVTGLEQVVIDLLSSFGIEGERQAGARGVWVQGRKIASLGINVRRWVTMHGIAINVSPDMTAFDLINPCGMPDVEMTSITRELGETVSISRVAGAFVIHFSSIFGCATEFVDMDARRQAPARAATG